MNNFFLTKKFSDPFTAGTLVFHPVFLLLAEQQPYLHLFHCDWHRVSHTARVLADNLLTCKTNNQNAMNYVPTSAHIFFSSEFLWYLSGNLFPISFSKSAILVIAYETNEEKLEFCQLLVHGRDICMVIICYTCRFHLW